MNPDAAALGAIALSYVLGSIPTGLWLGRAFRGVDIREHGSKNIGATNTMRVLGKGLGAVALNGDMAKGVVPVLIFARATEWPHAPLACGLAAILGHTLSIFLSFRGGKGVATSAGVFLALAPLAAFAAAVVFGIVVGTTRMVSAGSILAAATLTAAVWVLPHDFPLRIIATLVAALVIVRHRTNIRRIKDGLESRI